MSNTDDGPTYQEFLIVAAIGLALLFVGLVSLYFAITIERAGILRFTGSLIVIAVGLYAIYAGWVGKPWVAKIKPDSPAERQRQMRERSRKGRRNQ